MWANVVAPCSWRTRNTPRPAGRGVADQYSPLSSSRRNTASPGSSLTGSFRQGVRRLSWLLPAHVQPGVSSVVAKPNVAWATTLDQGAGGMTSFARSTWMTYARPSSANPPMPLKYSRPDGSAGASTGDGLSLTGTVGGTAGGGSTCVGGRVSC